MNEIVEKINSVIGPMIVPLPLSDKYNSSIILSDEMFIHNIQLQKNSEIVSADFLCVDSINIHEYILNMVLKAKESMIIYNDIKKEVINGAKLYHLHIRIMVGNKIFEYRYLTENIYSFFNHLEKYILALYNNKLNGLADELYKIDNTKDISQDYKFKTKRKSLI